MANRPKKRTIVLYGEPLLCCNCRFMRTNGRPNRSQNFCGLTDRTIYSPQDNCRIHSEDMYSIVEFCTAWLRSNPEHTRRKRQGKRIARIEASEPLSPKWEVYCDIKRTRLGVHAYFFLRAIDKSGRRISVSIGRAPRFDIREINTAIDYLDELAPAFEELCGKSPQELSDNRHFQVLPPPRGVNYGVECGIGIRDGIPRIWLINKRWTIRGVTGDKTSDYLLMWTPKQVSIIRGLLLAARDVLMLHVSNVPTLTEVPCQDDIDADDDE